MVGNGTRSVAQRRRLVELVGAAGAGKTTVAHLLRRPDFGMRAAPGLWSLPRGPLGLNTLRLLPRVLGFYRAVPSWKELKQIVRLDTLYKVVGRRNGATGPVLLDEGPVLALGWLAVNGDDRIRRPAFGAWRDDAIARWATALDVVVVLDAPDAVLARRIRERAKPHEVKGGTDEEIAAFAQKFRAALAGAIAALQHTGTVAVIRIDTSDDPPETTAARIRTALDRVTDGD